MPITNHERIGNALDLLKSGLAPSVEREFKSIYKDRAFADALGRSRRRWLFHAGS